MAGVETALAELRSVHQQQQAPASNSSSAGAKTNAAAAAPPSLKEVASSIDALRNGAAAGIDNITAPLLKAGPVMVTWLHRVITAVWLTGCAPVDWKRALLVPLFKGKGDKKLAGNYRPISLLSIPGKVYALILLSRVSAQVEGQLHDCQCAFRKNRGLSDATFALRMLMSKCREYKQPLYLAFVDLRKAYDSIHRDALWRILRAYGVDDKLVELLMDLHTGTQAAVKLAGNVSDWFEIECGVRQGCVIAPLLFNVFFDCVVRQALAAMPEGCGVQLSYSVDGGLFDTTPGVAARLQIISMLLYADDMVLLSCNKAELEMMLTVMDDICNKMGMCINASKTELMAMEPPFDGSCPLPEGVQLSGGTAK
jgi:hypothetical protein